MKKGLLILSLLCFLPLHPQNATPLVSGKITDVWGTPIPNVNLLVKDTTIGTQTDESGVFSLSAQTGEILIISSIGYGTIEYRVTEKRSGILITLSPMTTKLNEVVVEKRKRKTKQDLLADYAENKNLIKTSFGILDKDRSSSSMRFVEGDDLANVGPDFLMTLKNHVPGMRVVRPPYANDVEVYLRRMSFSIDTSGAMNAAPKAIFDVDGIILETAPTYLNASDIDRLVVLERNGAISRYGPRGIGGVIIINTKGKNQMDERGIERRYDNSAMRDSLYDLFASKTYYAPLTPHYMDGFAMAASKPEARAILQDQMEIHGKDPNFYLDLAYYFKERWQDPKISGLLLDEVQNKFPDNLPALKSLAYRYGTMGQNEKALEVYHKILQLDESSPQSYEDVVLAHLQLHQDEKAREVSLQYQSLIADSPATAEPAGDENENHQHFPIHRRFLNVGKDSKNLDFNASLTCVNIAIANKDAHTTLRIIDPEANSTTWTHAPSTESKTGMYMSTQFFIEQEPKGEWQVKLQQFEGAPTFIRFTVFFDYGLPSEYKRVMLFKLTPDYSGNHLFSINAASNTILE
nr:carboxypeptidase-like regulatory domain-containing protein [Allomuricauda sp.]